jgi:hypothetical protein
MNWIFALAPVVLASFMFANWLWNRAAYSRMHSTVANMAAILLATRLRDTKYMDEVKELRQSLRTDWRPGWEEEEKFARERLKEIDYMETSEQQQWISLAWAIYRGVAHSQMNLQAYLDQFAALMAIRLVTVSEQTS